MKHHEYLLTDDMIVELMDARLSSVEFSAAIKKAKIPELLVHEAHDYWKVISKMDTIKDVRPRAGMFDRIMDEVNPAAASRTPAFSYGTPSSLILSPYMKQLFAVAGALTALVVVISSIDFSTATPRSISSPVVLRSGAIQGDAARSALAPIPMQGGAAPAAFVSDVAAKAAPAPIVAVKQAPNARSVGFAAGFARVADAPQEANNPEQLVVVLAETGTQEATPDTYIDDAYDRQLAAYDAEMTSTSTIAQSVESSNSSSYEK